MDFRYIQSHSLEHSNYNFLKDTISSIETGLKMKNETSIEPVDCSNDDHSDANLSVIRFG